MTLYTKYYQTQPSLTIGNMTMMKSTLNLRVSMLLSLPVFVCSLALNAQPAGTSANDTANLETLTVVGERTGSYTSTEARTALRGSGDLLQTPLSVQVVTRDLIDDRNLSTIGEVLDTVSGVNTQPNFQGVGSQFILRGFIAQRVLRNGALTNQLSNGALTFSNLENIERVEVLKGAASAAYGHLEPGGVVNLVTKKPLTTPLSNVALSVGSFSALTGSIDLSRPFNASGSLAGRVNIGLSDGESYRDFVETRRLLVAPSLRWTPSENLQVLTEVEYLADRSTYDNGFQVGFRTPAPDYSVFLRLPRSRFLGQPDNFADNRLIVGTNTVDMAWGEALRLRNVTSLRHHDSDREYIFPLRLDAADNRSLVRSVGVASDLNFGLFNQLQAEFDFRTGSISHSLIASIDYGRESYDIAIQTRAGGSMDVFEPDYVLDASSFAPSPGNNYDQDQTALGLVLQDRLQFSPRLSLLLGLRADRVKSERLNTFNNTRQDQSDHEVTGRAGINYEHTPTFSTYFSFSQSYNPELTGVRVDGSFLDPSKGEQFELGIKATPLDQQLLLTAAIFDLRKTKVPTGDPANPNFSIQTAEQQSRGLELDVSGNLLPHWSLGASYTYTDAKISESDNVLFPVGQELGNIPRHAASLFSSYRISSGALRGLGLGAGLYYKGRREAVIPNTIQLDSYTRVDATIFYEQPQYTIALSLKNLTNEFYFEAVESRIKPQAPRAVLLSLRLRM